MLLYYFICPLYEYITWNNHSKRSQAESYMLTQDLTEISLLHALSLSLLSSYVFIYVVSG